MHRMHPDAGNAKRQKLDAEAPIIRPSLVSEQSRQKLKADYGKAKPYPHLVLKDVCNPEKLRAVREEVINNIEATYKETDLFKMFQTGEPVRAGSWKGGGEQRVAGGGQQTQAGVQVQVPCHPLYPVLVLPCSR